MLNSKIILSIRKKQTKKLESDAKRVDYEVLVNNNNENCNIKCSPGFYVQIARPCFSALKTNSVINSGIISLSVADTVINKDKKNYEANRKIRFNFMSQNKQIGGVTVHLHHSARLVQIQGSCVMPDKSKAAIWFAKAIIEIFRKKNIMILF